MNDGYESTEPFKVFVRIRPLSNEKEPEYHHLIIKKSSLKVIKYIKR